jgi:pimeloyl-ACP methyl ester carboxylesterase
VAVAPYDGRDVRYELAGPGDGADRPTVTFVGDVGYGPWLWGWQAPALTGPRRTLVWDLRGTGDSDPPPAGCDVGYLAGALEAVLADAGVRRTHVVGAGLGGMVALASGHRGAESGGRGRTRSLTLCGTAPAGEAVDADALDALALDRADPSTCDPSLSGAFTPSFREARPDHVARICEWRSTEDATGAARERQAAAALGFGGVPLHEVTVPALVLHGEADPVVPVEAGRRLARALPRGEFAAVAGRHLAFVEHARAVSDRLAAFLDRVEDGG